MKMISKNEKERLEEAVQSTQELEPARVNSPAVSNPDSEIHAKAFDIMVYHVTDRHGMHRFLTMNSLSPWLSEGREGFERVLAWQYKTFEWLGSTPALVTSADPPEGRCLDPDGSEKLYDRVRALMDTSPNSSGRLEAWLPDPEERVAWGAVEPLFPWKPMSTLKQAMGGKIDLDRIAIAFVDKDVCEMEKPALLDVVRARGRALLREFREDLRKVLESSLLRSIERSAEAPDQQGGGY